MDDLQPGMRIWGVKLELGSQLMQQNIRVRMGNISCELQPVQREGPEQLRQHHTTMDQKCRTCTPQHWIGALNDVTVSVTYRWRIQMENLTSVAAQVQADTIPDAIRPGLTLRDALLNSSEFFGEYAVYRAWIAVRHIINALKNRPMPVRMVDFQVQRRVLSAQTYRRLTRKYAIDENLRMGT